MDDNEAHPGSEPQPHDPAEDYPLEDPEAATKLRHEDPEKYLRSRNAVLARQIDLAVTQLAGVHNGLTGGDGTYTFLDDAVTAQVLGGLATYIQNEANIFAQEFNLSRVIARGETEQQVAQFTQMLSDVQTPEDILNRGERPEPGGMVND
jgi:hypothetical protein